MGTALKHNSLHSSSAYQNGIKKPSNADRRCLANGRRGGLMESKLTGSADGRPRISSRRGRIGCTHLVRSARARSITSLYTCTDGRQTGSSKYVSAKVGCYEQVRAKEGTRWRRGSWLTIPGSHRRRRHAEPSFRRRRQQVHLGCRRRSCRGGWAGCAPPSAAPSPSRPARGRPHRGVAHRGVFDRSSS